MATKRLKAFIQVFTSQHIPKINCFSQQLQTACKKHEFKILQAKKINTGKDESIFLCKIFAISKSTKKEKSDCVKAKNDQKDEFIFSKLQECPKKHEFKFYKQIN